VTYLLDKGIESIKSHNDELINQMRQGICLDKYEIMTPMSDSDNSTILVISHQDKTKNEAIFELLKKNNIFVSLRSEHLRFAPHLYNTADEIEKALCVLNDA
jgi:selenocysteine lyase/cysteine desulfurase